MTGENREIFKRRLRRLYASITGKAWLKKVDMAESAGGWTLCRGLHRAACLKLPEYGDEYQVHVQQPFDKLNLYTATLTIAGEDEPLLHTKFCPTPVEALSNLRIMIMVCEDPGTKEKKLAGQRKNEECLEEEDADKEELERYMESEDLNKEKVEGHVESEDLNKGKLESPVKSDELTKEQDEDAMDADEEALNKEILARKQWESTLARLGGKRSRHAVGGRKAKVYAAQ
ncbi:hypothetical protein QM012_009033 [Aureobasidium pullulans]|uniref:Uncharacterized protein n=1 Tax=Aureobasidium pullulans TaxID=5580 RepID=A0ABR0TIB2_AURPU